MNYYYQQAISYLVNKDIPVFIAFLDEINMFDRTDYNLLSTELMFNRPLSIVRMLAQESDHANEMGTSYSNPFSVVNGARVTSEPMSGCHLPLTFSRDQAGWAAIWELVNLLLFGNMCVGFYY